MKKQTQAEKQREKFAQLAARVCSILQISQEQYNELRFELAYEYNEARGNETVYAFSKTYWGWWITSYAAIDSAFIIKHESGANEGKTRDEVITRYRAMQVCNPLHVPDNAAYAITEEIEQYENERDGAQL